MYTTVTRLDFHDAFNKAGKNNPFSYEALDALYDYYKDDDVELDVIGLCREWTEYKNIKDYNSQNDTNYADTLAIILAMLGKKVTINLYTGGFLVLND